MASNPLFIIPDFFRIFQTNFAMAILGLKEIGKFFWESREKVLLILGLDNFGVGRHASYPQKLVVKGIIRTLGINKTRVGITIFLMVKTQMNTYEFCHLTIF